MINPAIEHWPMQKTIRGFTIIRPAATFSLREKESNRTRLAKREAPEGRHERARGVSPGYDVPKKQTNPGGAAQKQTWMDRINRVYCGEVELAPPGLWPSSLSQRERAGERENAK
jgi:hypothetical protein